MAGPAALLPGPALVGRRVGISVSESPDLERLGLFESHLRLALGEITRTVIVAGGDLAYGGHLAPDGYTAFMLAELQRYARRDRPLLVCLAWPEHRRMPLSQLEQQRRALGLLGRMACLDESGAEVDPADGRGEEPRPVEDQRSRERALTGMRTFMRDRQVGRVFIGGQRRGFQGRLPGLMEEALLALQANQPIYLAGGFGGVTLDIARMLRIDNGEWFPDGGEQDNPDPRYAHGAALLAEVTRSSNWTGLHNGLTTEEQRLLATTHRPSEITTLVGLGLRRWAQQQ